MALRAFTLGKEFVLERKTSPVARKARNNPFLTKKLTPCPHQSKVANLRMSYSHREQAMIYSDPNVMMNLQRVRKLLAALRVAEEALEDAIEHASSDLRGSQRQNFQTDDLPTLVRSKKPKAKTTRSTRDEFSDYEPRESISRASIPILLRS